MVQDSNLQRRDGGASAWYDKVRDVSLRADLERIEDRIYSYGHDVLDGWLGMAQEFASAKPKLVKIGEWQSWIEHRFAGFIGQETADRLAKIGETERSELAALRNTYFQRGTGISAIAAYLSAPIPVQELVRAGEIERTGLAIERATNDPASEEFNKLTAELARANAAAEAARQAEKRANDAMAHIESRIDVIKREAEFQADLRVQDVTARLQREVDEARHQADMRQRDMEIAQREIRQTQSHWAAAKAAFQAQVTEAATKAQQAERDRAEREYSEKMRKLQERMEAQERDARESHRRLKEINDRLNDARNAVGIRARWDILAADLVTRMDDAFGRLPSLIDAQYFEVHERTLVDSVLKRAEELARRMKVLASAGATVVDA
jgi:hypothetical protein